MTCTKYEIGDWQDYYETYHPCHCPVCGGFLTWKGETPICNKCKTELMAFPNIDEETGKEEEFGKICPISVASDSFRNEKT